MKISVKMKSVFAFLKRLIVKNKIYLLIIFVFGLIVDVFFYPLMPDSIIVLLASIWILNIFNYKLKPKYSLFLATMSYFVSLISQLFGKEFITEESASWFFVFLSLATGQRIIKGFSKK